MRSAVLLSSFLLLAACGSYVPTFYKLDIRQGNILEQERVQRLQTGLSRRQVEALLGTPPIVDPFNPQRWDYVYILYPRGNKEKGEQRHFSLFFTGDSLTRIEGDIEGYEIEQITEETVIEDGVEIEQITEETVIEDGVEMQDITEETMIEGSVEETDVTQ